MRVSSVKSKKQSSFHWPSNPIFHSTPWPLWTLPWPRYHQHLHKNCGGQDGDSKCRGCWSQPSQPRNCSKKTIRLTDGALCWCVFLGCSSQRWNWDSTSWRSTVPLLNILLGEGFPYSKSVISTTQLARLNWKSIYCPPVAWGKYDQVSRKSTSEFPNKTLVLVGGLVSKQKLQKMIFSDTLLMEKKSAPVDMVNI